MNDLKAIIRSKESKEAGLISIEEEYLLLEQAQKGNITARDRLVLVHLPFIKKRAKKIRKALYEEKKQVPLNDLVSEGTLGLIQAIESFDFSKEVRFLTYAGHWIEKYIRAELRRQLSPVYIPSGKVTLANKIKKARELFFSKWQCEPTIADIADYLGLPENHLAGVQLPGRKSIDTYVKVIGKNETAPLHKVLADDSKNLEELIHNEDIRKQWQLLLSKLTLKQRTVIELHFGLNEKEAQNLTEIADHLGITTEGARQLKEAGLKSLRKIMAGNR